MLEERRQLVGEGRVLSYELLNVAGRLHRRADVVVEHSVKFVDNQRVQMVLVADRDRREDDGTLHHFHVHLASSPSASASAPAAAAASFVFIG